LRANCEATIINTFIDYSEQTTKIDFCFFISTLLMEKSKYSFISFEKLDDRTFHFSGASYKHEKT